MLLKTLSDAPSINLNLYIVFLCFLYYICVQDLSCGIRSNLTFRNFSLRFFSVIMHISF